MKYNYLSNAGAVQDAAPKARVQAKRKKASPPPPEPVQQMQMQNLLELEQAIAEPEPAERFSQLGPGPPAARQPARPAAPSEGLDPQSRGGRSTMWYHVVEEGQQALMTRSDGRVEVVVGPKKVWRWGRRMKPMAHHVAHPGEFLICRYRDGRQEHLTGPAHIWADPREVLSVEKEDALQIADKEVVVVYSREGGTVSRRLVRGPAAFVPAPGEWLHTFSWHGSKGGASGYQKVPNGLVFQKLWLMPDQMYHDVEDVRTADDAVITIRLMIFFELVDIERMLETTHDPIGDFVNAATSDIVDFVGRHSFEAFKQHTEQLNDTAAYRQLTARAEQSGYRINKVVYRGYGAPESLQQMHDQAIESRTRLQLEKATEEQAQELEDFRLDRQLKRAAHQREERDAEAAQALRLEQEQHAARLAQQQASAAAEREQQAAREASEREHLAGLKAMGVDLTALLTHTPPDRTIEVRGAGGTHLHVAESEAD